MSVLYSSTHTILSETHLCKDKCQVQQGTHSSPPGRYTVTPGPLVSQSFSQLAGMVPLTSAFMRLPHFLPPSCSPQPFLSALLPACWLKRWPHSWRIKAALAHREWSPSVRCSCDDDGDDDDGLVSWLTPAACHTQWTEENWNYPHLYLTQEADNWLLLVLFVCF